MTSLATRTALADAYSVAGASWQSGASKIYDELAREQLAAACIPLAGARVLDLGSGTGAATRAALEARARTLVAVDVAIGMLGIEREQRPPAVVADARALPFTDAAFDAVVAAFSLNHLSDPASALREAARVTRPGGWVLASSYADDDNHPVKPVVEEVLGRRGWEPEPWHRWMRSHATVRLATSERARRAATRAGLVDIDVVARRVPFPGLGAADLVEWRLGMGQYAPFLAALSAETRAAVRREALDAMAGHAAPLVRSVLFLKGRVDRKPATPRR